MAYCTSSVWKALEKRAKPLATTRSRPQSLETVSFSRLDPPQNRSGRKFGCSGPIIIFHLSLDFPENKGSHFPSKTPPFGVRLCEVAMKFEQDVDFGLHVPLLFLPLDPQEPMEIHEGFGPSKYG